MCGMNSKAALSNEFKLQDLYVEITNKCNLYCKYCCRNSSSEDNREMSAVIFEKLLSEAKKLGCGNITLTGGEAILHHDFEKMLDQCLTYGYNVTVLSNGVAIEKIPDYFLQKLHGIQISIDGGTADYNDRTRGSGSFDKINKCIQYLLGKNMANEKLNLKMTITHDNILGIESLIELAVKYDIPNVGFSFLYKEGRAETFDQSLFVTDKDKESILEILNIAKDKNPNLNIQSPAFTDKCPLLKEKDEISLVPRIDCTGKVYACQMFSDEFWIGDLCTEHLEDILRGFRFENLRNLGVLRESFVPECQTCTIKKKCGKGCPAISLFDSITSTDSNCGLRRMHTNEVYHAAVKWIKKQQVGSS